MKCLTILLLLIFTSIAQAQEDAAPWPPDPSDIFAEGVEIVEISLPEPPAIDTNPQIDNEARVVRLYSAETGEPHEVTFPDGVDRFSNPELRSDGTLLLPTFYQRDTVPPQEFWILDPNNNEFTLSEVICGQPRALQGEGQWIAYYEDYDYQSNTPGYLCNTETGELLGPLNAAAYLRPEIFLSPDGKNAILFASNLVYSFSFESQDLLLLGEVDATDIQSATWLNTEEVLIYSTFQGDTFNVRYYYLADATREGSLERITSVLEPTYITLRENPSRYEWITVRDNECYLVQLYAEGGQREEYPLNGLCTQGTIIPDGTNDRLSFEISHVENEYAATASLVRFNPYTGQRLDLLEGEIEWLADISSDGRYASVLMDRGSYLDNFPRGELDEYTYFRAPEQNTQPYWIILDLATGEIVYQIPTQWGGNGMPYCNAADYYEDRGLVSRDSYVYLRHCAANSLFSIGSDLFLLVEPVQGEPYALQSELTDLRGEEVSQSAIGDIALVLPNNAGFLVWRQGRQNSTSLSLYNITTSQTTSLLNSFPVILSEYAVVSENYAFLPQLSDTENAVAIRVNPVLNGEADYSRSITYTIRLPSLHNGLNSPTPAGQQSPTNGEFQSVHILC